MTLANLITTAEQNREAWKYTSLRSLRDVLFVPAQTATINATELPPLLDANGQRLVFVNGVFQPALSSMAHLPPDLISGDAAQGYALTVQDQTCLATVPLGLLCITTKAAAAQQSTVKLAIHLGAHARLTLVERHISHGNGAAHAAIVAMVINLAEQSKLLHLKFQMQDTSDYHLANTQVHLAKGAHYDQFSLTTGAALSRHAVDVTLAASGAQTKLHGAYLLRDAQHGDITTVIHHAAPNTHSQEHYRGVLDGKARGIFQGKIIVAPHAQKSDGQQMSRALLLSDQAEANHKPELEIYADDVKCSHGATIGQLDDQALFYLRSRGIPTATARAMLIAAFIDAVIDAVSSEAGKAFAAEAAHAWYGEPHG